MVQAPEVNFSAWTQWVKRCSIPNIAKPGVYLLAHFATRPDDVDPAAQEVVYIGETCDQTLRNRLGQFHRCASEGKGNHSGGLTYWQQFQGKEIERLFVSGFPVAGLLPQLVPLYIRYIERKLIWEYGMRWGNAPRCNSK